MTIDPHAARPEGTEAIRWKAVPVDGYKIGAILTGEKAGCRCAKPINGPDILLIRIDEVIVMRMPNGAPSSGLPVSAVLALKRRNAHGTLTVGEYSVPFDVVASLASDAGGS